MVPVLNGVHNSEIEEEPQRISSGMMLVDYIPIYIPAIERGLLNQSRQGKERRFLDFLKARPSNEWFLGVLRRDPNQASEPPPPDPITDAGRERRRFRVPFVRKINWGVMWKSFKKWIRSPEHIAFLIWLIFVAAGLLVLFLVMTGILNGAIPSSNQRNNWEEIINQILNALFTMMALYEHPKLFHHLVLLLRWRSGDEVEVRKIYSKNGAPKPNERRHMLVVVVLLHITCFSQYVLCGLYWGYTRTTRPDWAENLSIAIGIVAPIIAVAYMLYSPLGRRSNVEQQAEAESQEANQEQLDLEAFEQRIVVTSPEWIGGLCDCTDDTTVACLSFCCTFCVFGWNMERLGFGNMYVHIITFVLFCTAPFWIFAIAALNVDDDTIKLILVITGSILCVFGLFYGGFWRTEMRKKFKLPGNSFCCWSPLLTDYVQWLFCWACSLSQEVRTANFYDIEDDGFYRKVKDEEGKPVLIPLPKEQSLEFLVSIERSRSCPPAVGPLELQHYSDSVIFGFPKNFERALTSPRFPVMAPPFPHLIRVEEERPLRSIELTGEKDAALGKKIDGT